MIPTLDPSRDGFTHSGMPIAAACSRQPGSPACANATCGNPWNSRSRLQISLSIATAAERTLGPAYGTSRTSSSPWTVPSSPNGPWRTGNATSTPSRPPAGRRESSVPSRSQRPSRSIRIRSTSWPAASRPSATEAPEFSETSCSEERPPEITATFTGAPLARAASASPSIDGSSGGGSSSSNTATKMVTRSPALIRVPAEGAWSVTRPS